MPTTGCAERDAAHRPVVPGPAVGEDPAVRAHEPVAPAVGSLGHAHHRRGKLQVPGGTAERASRRRRPRRRTPPACTPGTPPRAPSTAAAGGVPVTPVRCGSWWNIGHDVGPTARCTVGAEDLVVPDLPLVRAVVSRHRDPDVTVGIVGDHRRVLEPQVGAEHGQLGPPWRRRAPPPLPWWGRGRPGCPARPGRRPPPTR